MTDYWNDPDGNARRNLYKFYGIKFIFTVYGEARKFSAENFAMNLGSGIGLLGIVSLQERVSYFPKGTYIIHKHQLQYKSAVANYNY